MKYTIEFDPNENNNDEFLYKICLQSEKMYNALCELSLVFERLKGADIESRYFLVDRLNLIRNEIIKIISKIEI